MENTTTASKLSDARWSDLLHDEPEWTRNYGKPVSSLPVEPLNRHKVVGETERLYRTTRGVITYGKGWKTSSNSEHCTRTPREMAGYSQAILRYHAWLPPDKVNSWYHPHSLSGRVSATTTHLQRAICSYSQSCCTSHIRLWHYPPPFYPQCFEWI